MNFSSYGLGCNPFRSSFNFDHFLFWSVCLSGTSFHLDLHYLIFIFLDTTFFLEHPSFSQHPFSFEDLFFGTSFFSNTVLFRYLFLRNILLGNLFVWNIFLKGTSIGLFVCCGVQILDFQNPSRHNNLQYFYTIKFHVNLS